MGGKRVHFRARRLRDGRWQVAGHGQLDVARACDVVVELEPERGSAGPFASDTKPPAAESDDLAYDSSLVSIESVASQRNILASCSAMRTEASVSQKNTHTQPAAFAALHRA
jgi:hypothetical protein